MNPSPDNYLFIDQDEPQLIIDFGGTQMGHDIVRRNNQIADLQQRLPGWGDDYHEALCELIQSWGYPRPTHNQAIKISDGVLKAYLALKKKEGPAPAPTDSSAPAASSASGSASAAPMAPSATTIS